MSIISTQDSDKSNFLCKRFASLASTYFDDPDEAQNAAAHVPLENLFRVLEMFRNDTFSDESRIGVLALEGQSPHSLNIHKEDSWHTEIKKAVHDSIVSTFGSTIPQTDAVEELQKALRGLAIRSEVTAPEVSERAKNFFIQLSVAL